MRRKRNRSASEEYVLLYKGARGMSMSPSMPSEQAFKKAAEISSYQPGVEVGIHKLSNGRVREVGRAKYGRIRYA